jgi:hypothetical protein
MRKNGVYIDPAIEQKRAQKLCRKPVIMRRDVVSGIVAARPAGVLQGKISYNESRENVAFLSRRMCDAIPPDRAD